MVYSYTDWNDVDEDLTAISVHGGGWSESVRVGAVRRTMNDTSTAIGGAVAFAQKINRTYSPFGDAYYANVEADLRGYHRQGIESQP